jgi:hypothetical protein
MIAYNVSGEIAISQFERGNIDKMKQEHYVAALKARTPTAFSNESTVPARNCTELMFTRSSAARK